MKNLIPAQTSEFFYPIIEDIATNPRKGLLSVSFVLSGILASNGVYTIFKAFSDSVFVFSNRTFIANYFISFLVSFAMAMLDRKSTRLNSSHVAISYAVFCLKKKTS